MSAIFVMKLGLDGVVEDIWMGLERISDSWRQSKTAAAPKRNRRQWVWGKHVRWYHH